MMIGDKFKPYGHLSEYPFGFGRNPSPFENALLIYPAIWKTSIDFEKSLLLQIDVITNLSKRMQLWIAKCTMADQHAMRQVQADPSDYIFKYSIWLSQAHYLVHGSTMTISKFTKE